MSPAIEGGSAVCRDRRPFSPHPAFHSMLEIVLSPTGATLSLPHVTAPTVASLPAAPCAVMPCAVEALTRAGPALPMTTR